MTWHDVTHDPLHDFYIFRWIIITDMYTEASLQCTMAYQPFAFQVIKKTDYMYVKALFVELSLALLEVFPALQTNPFCQYFHHSIMGRNNHVRRVAPYWPSSPCWEHEDPWHGVPGTRGCCSTLLQAEEERDRPDRWSSAQQNDYQLPLFIHRHQRRLTAG